MVADNKTAARVIGSSGDRRQSAWKCGINTSHADSVQVHPSSHSVLGSNPSIVGDRSFRDLQYECRAAPVNVLLYSSTVSLKLLLAIFFSNTFPRVARNNNRYVEAAWNNTHGAGRNVDVTAKVLGGCSPPVRNGVITPKTED